MSSDEDRRGRERDAEEARRDQRQERAARFSVASSSLARRLVEAHEDVCNEAHAMLPHDAVRSGAAGRRDALSSAIRAIVEAAVDYCEAVRLEAENEFRLHRAEVLRLSKGQPLVENEWQPTGMEPSAIIREKRLRLALAAAERLVEEKGQ